MPEIYPVRGWRYSPALGEQLDELTAPLFDVGSERQRAARYQQPLNALHLSVPRAEDGLAPAAAAARRLARWQAAGVLRQDELPGIYAYYQYFQLPGEARARCRKGFICQLRATDWAAGQVLRHERTLPAAVAERTELLAALQLQTSATHGLYRDEARALDALLDEAVRDPLLQTGPDEQGVRHVLALVQDVAAIRRCQAVLAGQPVLLADGHHRYEASVAYRRAQLAATGADPAGFEPWQFHLMYLSNAAGAGADELPLLPTHRVLRCGPAGFDAAALLARLAEFFDVRPEPAGPARAAQLAGRHGVFGLYLPGGASYALRLRPGLPGPGAGGPDSDSVVRALDLTRLHYYAFERALGVPGAWPGLAYVRELAECVRLVDQGEAQAAFFTGALRLAEVEAVARAGAVLPPKATFFYPKVLGGLLFASLAANEPPSVFDAVFWPPPAP